MNEDDYFSSLEGYCPKSQLRKIYPEEFVDWLERVEPKLFNFEIPVAYAGWSAAIDLIQKKINNISDN
jgi:hypothetical protein